MTHSPHYEIKSGYTLADKSDAIFDIFGNRACAWRHGECMGRLCCVNVTQNGMSLKIECNLEWNVTFKWNVNKMKCHLKWNVTQNGMSFQM